MLSARNGPRRPALWRTSKSNGFLKYVSRLQLVFDTINSALLLLFWKVAKWQLDGVFMRSVLLQI